MAHCSENEHVEGLAASTDTSLLEQYWARTTAAGKIDQQSPTTELQQPVSGRGAGHQGQRARSTVCHTSHRLGCQMPPATCAGLRCACDPASMVRRQGNHDSALPVLHTSALPKGSPFPADGGDGQQFGVTAAQHLSYARPLAQSGPSGPARCRCERRTNRRLVALRGSPPAPQTSRHVTMAGVNSLRSFRAPTELQE